MAIEFDLPEGFQTPEDVEPGQSFDAVASLKMGENGEVELVAIDGIPLSGTAESSKEEEQEGGETPNPAMGANQVAKSGYKSFMDAMA